MERKLSNISIDDEPFERSDDSGRDTSEEQSLPRSSPQNGVSEKFPSETDFQPHDSYVLGVPSKPKEKPHKNKGTWSLT